MLAMDLVAAPAIAVGDGEREWSSEFPKSLYQTKNKLFCGIS